MEGLPSFSGQAGGTSVNDWLHRVEIFSRYHHPPAFTPERMAIDILSVKLTGIARSWATDNKTIFAALSSKPAADDAIDKDRYRIISTALRERFPTATQVSFEDTEADTLRQLNSLKQATNESVTAYYERSAGLLSQAGLDDNSDDQQTPKPLALLRKTITDQWVRGLKDNRITYDVSRTDPPTVHQAFVEARRSEAFHKQWASGGDVIPVVGYPSPPQSQIGSPPAARVVPTAANAPPLATQVVAPNPTRAPGQTQDARYSAPSAPANRFPHAINPPFATRFGQRDGNRENRLGFPPAESAECFRILPAEAQKIIRDNQGAKFLCCRCGEPGHLAPDCQSKALDREIQECLRLFIGIAFSISRLPTSVQGTIPRAVLTTTVGYSKYPFVNEEQPQAVETASHLQQPWYDEEEDQSEGYEVHSRLSRISLRNQDEKNKAVRASGSKRVRVTDLLNDNQTEDHAERPGTQPHDRPMAEAKGKVGKQKRLQPMIGTLGEPDFDLRSLLKETDITIPFLSLLAISPNQRVEMRRLMSQPKKTRKKRSSRRAPKVLPNNVPRGDKGTGSGSFYVDVKVKHNKQLHTVDSVVDPGSEINVITTATVERMGLRVMPLENTRLSGLYMVTSDGSRRPMSGWVDVPIDLASIRGVEEFFVLPASSAQTGYGILLGVPYLVAHNATIHMRKMQIALHDDDGRRVVISGPSYHPEDPLRLSHESFNKLTLFDSDDESDETASSSSENESEDDDESEDDSDSSASEDSPAQTTSRRSSRPSRHISVGLPDTSRRVYTTATSYEGPLSGLASACASRRFTLIDDVTGAEAAGEAFILTENTTPAEPSGNVTRAGKTPRSQL